MTVKVRGSQRATDLDLLLSVTLPATATMGPKFLVRNNQQLHSTNYYPHLQQPNCKRFGARITAGTKHQIDFQTIWAAYQPVAGLLILRNSTPRAAREEEQPEKKDIQAADAKLATVINK